jgi:hypothetical protein
MVYAHPSNLVMYALLLRIPCRAVRVQFSRCQVFIQDVEIRVPLKNARVNRG